MEITEKLLRKLYLEKKMGITRIAKYLNVGTRVIRTRLDRFNIPKRDFREIPIPSRLGATLSEKTKMKISKSHTGKKLTQEHKDNIHKGMGGNDVVIWNNYAFLRIPNHPKAIRGRIKRAIIVAEKKLGRYLKPNECTHHINGDKLDDRPENIIVMTHSTHSKLHCKEKWEKGIINREILKRS